MTWLTPLITLLVCGSFLLSCEKVLVPGTTILPALRAIDTPEACSADLVAGLCNGEKI